MLNVQPASLENQLQSKLELPRIEGLVRRGDLAELACTRRRGTYRARLEAGNRSTPTVDENVGLAEILRVGEVINLGPELELHPLLELEVTYLKRAIILVEA